MPCVLTRRDWGLLLEAIGGGFRRMKSHIVYKERVTVFALSFGRLVRLMSTSGAPHCNKGLALLRCKDYCLHVPASLKHSTIHFGNDEPSSGALYRQKNESTRGPSVIEYLIQSMLLYQSQS